MSGRVASDSAVHARVTVYPVRECPVTRVAAAHGLRGLVAPDGHNRAPQAIVDTVDAEGLRELGAHPVLRTGDATICRLPTLAPTDQDAPAACGHGHCLAHGFGFLPVDPYHVRWNGDAAVCSFAALDARTVRRTTRALADADFAIELDQLVQAGEATEVGIEATAAVLALDELTERQREVAAAAVTQGYFDTDGPSAADIAADLGISKSTLSEHLRIVQRTLAEQAFG